MYTGKMIDELLEMVVRAEGRAHEVHAAIPDYDRHPLASRFVFDAAEAQPMLIGVA